MLTSIQTRSHIPNSPEILGGGIVALGVGAVLSLDQLQGMHATREYRTHPELYTATPSESRHTVGFLLGCMVDGRAVFDRARAHSPNQNLAVMGYAEKNLDSEQVCESFSNYLKANRVQKPSFVCHSMGGIPIRHLLEYARDTDLADHTEGFGAIVLDDTIHDADDIRMPYSALLKGAMLARNSWFVDRAKPRVMGALRSDHEFSVQTHVATIATEGEFIFRNDHPNGDYSDLVEAAYFVHGPSGDRVVKTDQSIEKFRANFPGKFHDIVDTTRAPGSHTGGMKQLDRMLQLANNSNNKNAV